MCIVRCNSIRYQVFTLASQMIVHRHLSYSVLPRSVCNLLSLIVVKLLLLLCKLSRVVISISPRHTNMFGD